MDSKDSKDSINFKDSKDSINSKDSKDSLDSMGSKDLKDSMDYKTSGVKDMFRSRYVCLSLLIFYSINFRGTVNFIIFFFKKIQFL